MTKFQKGICREPDFVGETSPLRPRKLGLRSLRAPPPCSRFKLMRLSKLNSKRLLRMSFNPLHRGHISFLGHGQSISRLPSPQQDWLMPYKAADKSCNNEIPLSHFYQLMTPGGGTPILDLTGCAAQQGVLLR